MREPNLLYLEGAQDDYFKLTSSVQIISSFFLRETSKPSAVKKPPPPPPLCVCKGNLEKKANGLLFRTVNNEVRVFLEYYLTFKQVSWLKNMCSSLARCFIVNNLITAAFVLKRNPPLEFAKVIHARAF